MRNAITHSLPARVLQALIHQRRFILSMAMGRVRDFEIIVLLSTLVQGTVTLLTCD